MSYSGVQWKAAREAYHFQCEFSENNCTLYEIADLINRAAAILSRDLKRETRLEHPTSALRRVPDDGQRTNQTIYRYSTTSTCTCTRETTVLTFAWFWNAANRGPYTDKGIIQVQIYSINISAVQYIYVTCIVCTYVLYSTQAPE